MDNSKNGFDASSLSDALANAAEAAAVWTVMVDARNRMPASGIRYRADLVLTADHVVERDDAIQVMLADGSTVSAQVAGRDPGLDLALLRFSSEAPFPSVPQAAEARVGALVLALGRPSPAGIEASLGVVSAQGGPARTGRGGLLERYLRSDATFFPGFSGGPLVDSAGRLLGLNTSGFGSGLSLTIPTALAWGTAQVLAEHGHVRRAYLGIRSQPVALAPAQRQALGRDQAGGLLLVGLEDDGPALRAGLLVGDILVGLGGQPLQDADSLQARLATATVGQPVNISVLRGGQLQDVSVTPGERP